MRAINIKVHSVGSDFTIGQRLKPRRGGLFIDASVTPARLFVFRRPALSRTHLSKAAAILKVLGRRKTKRKRVDLVSGYKQATPTGFENLRGKKPYANS